MNIKNIIISSESEDQIKIPNYENQSTDSSIASYGSSLHNFEKLTDEVTPINNNQQADYVNPDLTSWLEKIVIGTSKYQYTS